MSNLLYSILLVEDDKEIIKNLTEFLNNEGFVVNSVTGQKDALLYVDEHMQDVDIVLLMFRWRMAMVLLCVRRLSRTRIFRLSF